MQLNGQAMAWLAETPGLVEGLFDQLPDVLFYVKDEQGRYRWANRTLIRRAGFTDVADVVGHTADQLFPVTGASTLAQDLAVIRTGHPMVELLRLYRTRRGERFWCLSSKFPLRGADGRIVGLAGLSRDLPRANERHQSYRRLASVVAFLDARLDQPVRIAAAAQAAALSMDTLARLTREVYHLTPKQLLMKKRIDRACQLLEDPALSITAVAAACGYADHSAFSRQFRAASHLTPGQYRRMQAAGDRRPLAEPGDPR